MEEWKEYKYTDCALIIGGGTPKTTEKKYWNGIIPWLSVKDFCGEAKYVYSSEKTITDLGLQNSSTKLLNKNDIIISARGTVGEIAMIPFEMAFNQSCFGIRANIDLITPDYLYYLTKTKVRELRNASHGSVFDTITKDTFDNIICKVPSIEYQKKVANILSSLDDKIELNRRINENLEQQAQALFNNMFGSQIDNLIETPYCLGDLVNCIDNRGKTPMLSSNKTDFPIIDVKALSGKSRIINYENCTKYVSEETYNTWFRSGHPTTLDVLMSTVGSLAELKIFLGTKGCIAQNVIGLRAKNISALYLYQYLLYVKDKLLTYNIGSVQPSIKVTHIIKYPILVPSENELRKFDEAAKHITHQIYTLNEQIVYLSNIRDSLLPKLMSGELQI